MRFLLAGSVPFWAFVTDLDTAGRLVGEDGGLLGPFSSEGPPGLDLRHVTSPDVSKGHARRSPYPAACRHPVASPVPRSGCAAEAASSAEPDSTEGWGAPASHPSVSAPSRLAGSSRVQFFARRARSSR